MYLQTCAINGDRQKRGNTKRCLVFDFLTHTQPRSSLYHTHTTSQQLELNKRGFWSNSLLHKRVAKSEHSQAKKCLNNRMEADHSPIK